MSRLLPKSNSSFLLSAGNALRSEVSRLRDETFLLDSGLGTPKICTQDELTRVPANRSVTKFENMVGFQERVAREIPVRGMFLERFFVDLLGNDPVLKEQAAVKFSELVESTDAVAGEPVLLLPRRFRQNRAWTELNKNWRGNKKVKGFILEKVRGGYKVAIGGYIAYLPYRPLIRRRILNDRFTIESISLKRNNFVVI